LDKILDGAIKGKGDWCVSQPKSRWDDKPKIKLEKTEFEVATIVYSRKLRKNRKDKTRSAKTRFWV